MNKKLHTFDLEERTFKFSSDILAFTKNIKMSYLTENQVKQLIKSSTSIGAIIWKQTEADQKKIL